MDVEGLQCVLIVSRNKDYRRKLFGRKRLDHFEAVLFRHLNIEENEIGIFVRDGFYRIGAIPAFADDLNIVLITKKALDPIAGKRFIIDDKRANTHCRLEVGIIGATGW